MQSSVSWFEAKSHPWCNVITINIIIHIITIDGFATPLALSLMSSLLISSSLCVKHECKINFVKKVFGEMSSKKCFQPVSTFSFDNLVHREINDMDYGHVLQHWNLKLIWEKHNNRTETNKKDGRKKNLNYMLALPNESKKSADLSKVADPRQTYPFSIVISQWPGFFFITMFYQREQHWNFF